MEYNYDQNSSGSSNKDEHDRMATQHYLMHTHHSATMPMAMPSALQNFVQSDTQSRSQTLGSPTTPDLMSTHHGMYGYSQAPSFLSGLDPMQQYQPHLLSDPGPASSLFSSSPKAETSTLAYALGPPQESRRPTGPLRSYSYKHKEEDGEDSDHGDDYIHSRARARCI